MGQIMSGIPDKDTVFLFIIDLLVVLLDRRYSIVKIHKIHTAAAVNVIGHGFLPENTERQIIIHCDASCCDIAEQLIAKSLSA